MSKHRFLVSLPTHVGDDRLHAYVAARSRDELERLTPDAQVLDPEPEWLSADQKEQIARFKIFDVDSPIDVKLLTTEPGLVFHRDNPAR